MKLIYLATSNVAVETFNALLKNHEILAVVTQPDKPQGRSNKLFCSPVACISSIAGVKIYKPDKIDNTLIDELKELNADLFITFSYGVILKEDFFSITRLGGINIHPSLLPKLRGPSPIKTAILQGFTETGITIQKMKIKVDSGDILYQEAFDILPDDDAVTLEKKVSSISADIINIFLDKFIKNEINPVLQDDQNATYCKFIKKDEGLISWSEKSFDIINKIRAFVNWPVCHCFIDKNRINIYKAKINNILNFNDYKNCSDGQIVFADKKNGIVVKSSDGLINLMVLQQKGKKVLEWKEFINGYRELNKKILEVE